MAKHERESFKSQRIVVDGNEYTLCHFEFCEMVFEGGTLPILVGNSFTNTRFTFDGAAARTIQFMTGLYGGGGKGPDRGDFG
jgi:hypothetical protein